MHVYLRPGQGFKKFMVKKRKKGLSESGKPITGGYEDVGQIIGTLVSASEKEKEAWKQNQHPITHKIVQQGVQNAAKATNYLVLSENGKKDRYFYVQGTSNPGELNHLMRYFVEERKDLKDG